MWFGYDQHNVELFNMVFVECPASFCSRAKDFEYSNIEILRDVIGIKKKVDIDSLPVFLAYVIIDYEEAFNVIQADKEDK